MRDTILLSKVNTLSMFTICRPSCWAARTDHLPNAVSRMRISTTQDGCDHQNVATRRVCGNFERKSTLSDVQLTHRYHAIRRLRTQRKPFTLFSSFRNSAVGHHFNNGSGRRGCCDNQHAIRGTCSHHSINLQVASSRGHRTARLFLLTQ